MYIGRNEPPDEAFFAKRRARRVTVGHDVPGSDMVQSIRPEVTIGTGAVGGRQVPWSRASVAPYTIVVGVPAEKDAPPVFQAGGPASG